MTELRVPKLNNNDDSYVLVDWLVDDGATVTDGQPVAEVETSKALEELVSSGAGVLRHAIAAGASCAPGDLLARVTATGEPAPAPLAREPESGEPLITEPAARLIAELGLDPEVVRAAGLKVVRRSDVERLAGPAAPVDVPLPAGQRAVARAVSESHATIPAAYTVVKVDVGAAVAEAASSVRRLRTLVGLPDLLVAAVAAVFDQHRDQFATPVDGAARRPAEAPHIGLTLDVGRGLFVPVVRDAAALGFDGIVKQIAAHRHTALFGAFRERDLQGANIAVTLHQERDVVLAVPIIFPGQLCSLALTAPLPELALAADGTVTTRTVVHLGLAYDHRFVNGRDAITLLHALKDALEAPQALTAG